MRKPDFFIVGASKCGTTAMYEYLNQHPEIYMSPEKEPAYFGRDLKPVRRSEEEYLRLFSGARTEKRIGEATTSYLYSKEAAAEIKNFCPAARIIIMLRNPVDMIHARHAQLYYHCVEDIEDFSQALDAERDRKEGRRLATSEHSIQHLFYRETAKYTEQINRYLDLFPADRVKVIIFDDFKSETARTYRETCEFLDVDPTFQPRFVVVNANKKIRSRFVQELLEIPGPTLRKLGRPLTPRSWRHRVMNKLRQLNSARAPRKPMDVKLRRSLQAEFAPEVMRLSELLNRDLSHWCNPREG
jgi:hypothetical protein